MVSHFIWKLMGRFKEGHPQTQKMPCELTQSIPDQRAEFMGTKLFHFVGQYHRYFHDRLDPYGNFPEHSVIYIGTLFKSTTIESTKYSIYN